ncbi:hypothetical protein LY28_02403 [Ruminiclostridium sufflavum DSM 19573]|uniref:Uncharacterized protein n=1 Tax=Ruminiclostridium sufflavum DSM 19573 TaxID=1121337 RepID=A0A318XKW9_9FIRM|nr:hypothetical protein [Ruminiclostridium sufflavum]PYG87023.1 hypothetical protein LY28_02403 [Ruminiclostridium sufflavum DSM 19573]
MGSSENKKKSKIHLLNIALCNMAELPKQMIKYATPAALFFIALGTALFAANKTSNNFSIEFEFMTTTLITNGFFVFAEFMIASLILDILIRKAK